MSKGKLYVIPTPIGNLGDITLRALETIESVDILICEDSRVAGSLVSKYMKRGLLKKKPEYLVYNDFNARANWEKIVELVSGGSKVGLVSDAGMPSVADPGYRLIRGCVEAEIEIEVLPGASAVMTALAASGLGGEHFMFTGFLPKKAGKRKAEIEKIAKVLEIYADMRVVIFMTPHRAKKDLEDLEQGLGERQAVIMREMTKKFEERIEGKLGELVKVASERKLKGEMVLVLKG